MVPNIIKKILANEVANKSYMTTRMRLFIYRSCGADLKSVSIRPNCYFSGFNVKMGEGTWINSGCHFDADSAFITLGERVSVGMEVVFCTSSHEISDEYKRAGKDIKEPIEVKDGSWIGARALILPGVTVGEGCIIAAGSVVTKDCKPNSLYAGTPARRIKELPLNNKISTAI